MSNLAVQRELPGHWVLDVAYLGVHGVDTVANINVNNPFRTQQFPRDDGSRTMALLWLINQRRNDGRSDFDRTLSYVQSYVYELPWGVGKRRLNRGPAAYALGNWQISRILTLMTGMPIGTVGASGSSLNTPSRNLAAAFAGGWDRLPLQTDDRIYGRLVFDWAMIERMKSTSSWR